MSSSVLCLYTVYIICVNLYIYNVLSINILATKTSLSLQWHHSLTESVNEVVDCLSLPVQICVLFLLEQATACQLLKYHPSSSLYFFLTWRLPSALTYVTLLCWKSHMQSSNSNPASRGFLKMSWTHLLLLITASLTRVKKWILICLTQAFLQCPNSRPVLLGFFSDLFVFSGRVR